MTVANSVVLVTGASEGIGAACVRQLRSRGARLSLNSRSEEKLARVARADDLVTAADLTAPDTPRLLIERTIERFGRIDTIINNAGHGIYWPAAASPERETRALFDLNFFAPLALSQAVIPYMRRQGSGTIVNVGSIAGHVALPWMPLYSASKSALGALTESLRLELKRDGIHVMLVCPGYVLTEFHSHSFGLAPPARVVKEKRFAISPDRCARDVVGGLERRARIVVTPRWGWFMIGMHRLMPRAVEAHLLQLNRSPEHL
jgi:short-subunit dehydrogenase